MDSGTVRDVIGIAMQILATFMAALAYVLQKLAHKEGTKPVWKNWKWSLGFLLMVATAGVDVYSFSLLDQSKLAAFAAVTMLWNIILSTAILKERFTRIDAISVTVISAGTVLALSASEATSKDFTLDEIVALLTDDFVYAYSSIVGFGVIVTALFIDRTARQPVETWTPFQGWCMAVMSPALGGMFMGFTGYAAKAISATLFHADWVQFTRLPIYVYLGVAGVAVSGQVRYLNTGLKFFDAMNVVPVFEAAIILSNSLGGIVYYRDLRDQSVGKKLMFAAGALMAIVGVNIQLLKKRATAGGAAKGWTAVGSGEGGDAEGSEVPLMGASDPVTMLKEVAEESALIVHGSGGGAKSARRRTPSTVIEMR